MTLLPEARIRELVDIWLNAGNKTLLEFVEQVSFETAEACARICTDHCSNTYGVVLPEYDECAQAIREAAK